MSRPRSCPTTAAVVVAAIATGLAGHAAAQPSAEAEALFRDARALMREGKIGEACEAFAASQQLEPMTATLLNLADCRERNGQLATAWALFLRADSETRDDPKQARKNATARRRAAALESRLSYLTINVPDESRIEGLVLTRNGVVVAPGAWNRAVPVDGGEYVVEGKAPGHEPWSTTVTVQSSSDRRAVEVPKFKELPALVSPPRDVEPTPPAAEAADEEEEEDDEEEPVGRAATTGGFFTLTPRRKLALGVTGGGVAVAAAGVVIGLRARSLQDDADAACPPATCTPDDAARAEQLNDDARRSALYANLGFGLAAAAIATGAVLYVTGAPRATSTDDVAVRPVLDARFVGVEAHLRFR